MVRNGGMDAKKGRESGEKKRHQVEEKAVNVHTSNPPYLVSHSTP